MQGSVVALAYPLIRKSVLLTNWNVQVVVWPSGTIVAFSVVLVVPAGVVDSLATNGAPALRGA